MTYDREMLSVFKNLFINTHCDNICARRAKCTIRGINKAVFTLLFTECREVCQNRRPNPACRLLTHLQLKSQFGPDTGKSKTDRETQTDFRWGYRHRWDSFKQLGTENTVNVWRNTVLSTVTVRCANARLLKIL